MKTNCDSAAVRLRLFLPQTIKRPDDAEGCRPESLAEGSEKIHRKAIIADGITIFRRRLLTMVLQFSN